MMDKPDKKFELIREIVNKEDNVLSVTELCRIAGVSRSGYYRWVNAEDVRRAREKRDQEDFSLILQAYQFRGYAKGIRGIHMRLLHLPEPVVMNVKKIQRLMRKYGLYCPIRQANPYRRMAKAIRTNTVADNLLNREFEQHGPRRVLLTDITYIPYRGVFCYLSTILDAFTKQVLAYVLSPSLELDFVLETVHILMSVPVRFCNFSPNGECKKMADKGVQPLNDYTCRFRPSSLKCTDKSGLDGLQADK